MGVRSSTFLTLVGGVVIAGASIAGLHSLPVVHAQTKIAPFTPRTISIGEADDLAGLEKADKATTDLVAFVEPGVVNIKGESGMKRDVMGQVVPAEGGEGSGVIYRPDGYIITNDHVVGGFDKVTVVLQDGRELPGKVTRAPDMDLAVVKVDATDLPTLPFADSSKVRAGQFAMAVGSPFGLSNTVTFGHVSATSRTNDITDDRLGLERFYGDMLQTDAPINMGNSGGPLVDVKGEVIGINTAIYSPTGMNQGIGFAIPSNTVRMVADKLISDGKIARGALGLRPTTLEPYKAKELGLAGGAKVVEVVNGTPAAIAGIQKDDVIVRVGNIPVTDESDVRDAMLSYGPGEKIEVEVVRGKAHKVFNVTLTAPDKLPQDPAQKQAVPRPDQVMPQFGQGQNPFDIPIPGFGNGGGQDDTTVPPIRQGDAKLGVTVSDLTSTLRAQFHIPADVKGALVTSVADSSAADKLGIQNGDVIEMLGGKPIDSAQALKGAMANRKWGESCTIKFSRFGEGTATTETLPFNF